MCELVFQMKMNIYLIYKNGIQQQHFFGYYLKGDISIKKKKRKEMSPVDRWIAFTLELVTEPAKQFCEQLFTQTI